MAKFTGDDLLARRTFANMDKQRTGFRRAFNATKLLALEMARSHIDIRWAQLANDIQSN